jgi:hypothetical protein
VPSVDATPSSPRSKAPTGPSREALRRCSRRYPTPACAACCSSVAAAASGQRFVESTDSPADYLETALDQADALDVLRRSTVAVDWTYLSPRPLHLVPGDKPGSYQTTAIDEPIVGDDGDSRISVGDFAPPPSTPSKTAPSFATFTPA